MNYEGKVVRVKGDGKIRKEMEDGSVLSVKTM